MRASWEEWVPAFAWITLSVIPDYPTIKLFHHRDTEAHHRDTEAQRSRKQVKYHIRSNQKVRIFFRNAFSPCFLCASVPLW